MANESAKSTADYTLIFGKSTSGSTDESVLKAEVKFSFDLTNLFLTNGEKFYKSAKDLEDLGILSADDTSALTWQYGKGVKPTEEEKNPSPTVYEAISLKDVDASGNAIERDITPADILRLIEATKVIASLRQNVIFKLVSGNIKNDTTRGGNKPASVKPSLSAFLKKPVTVAASTVTPPAVAKVGKK